MADKAHRAGVGFALLLGPQQAQAILLSMKNLPPGVDPRAFGRRMNEIAARHGMFMINTTDAFADVQRPELDFFPVDGHPEEKGNVVMADATVRRLVAGDVAPFAACIGGELASKHRPSECGLLPLRPWPPGPLRH